MALKLRIGTSERIQSTPITEGYVYFAKDTQNLFLDDKNERYIVNGANVFFNTTENWNANRDIIGENNCMYVYTDYKEIDGQSIPGVKVGDGKAYLIDMPFLDADLEQRLDEHINNTDIHVSEQDRLFWNNKVSCYLDATDNENIIFTTN